MIFRLYIARLKCIVRNKEVIFWSFMFPILLASCFFFAFQNIFDGDSFHTISIAYDNRGAETNELENIINEAELSDGMKMFDVTYSNKEEAGELLKNGVITAYIAGGNEPELIVRGNGIYQTITKAFLDNYLQRQSLVHSIMEQNPNAINEGLIRDVMQFDSFVNEVENKKNPEVMLIYFYALLAYTCVFAADRGLDEVINIQADQSLCGARMNVSPLNKMKLFLCNLMSAFTTHIISVLLLFSYMYFILKVQFGDNLPYLLLICILGSLTGITLGATIGIWVKKKAEVKEAILTAVVLGAAFLSGMMALDMKYLIAQKCPLLAYINPVTLLTDAMYSLYYFDNYDRFYLNALLLGIITVVLGVASYLGIRRKNYASI